MLHQLALTERTFASSFRDSTGRSLPCYRLPEHELMVLLTGYSVPLRATVIARWKELEKGTKPALPGTYVEALNALTSEVEAREVAQAEVLSSPPGPPWLTVWWP